MIRLVLLFFLVLSPISAWAGDVNLNVASAAELDALPGIGPAKAAAIIAYRDGNGPFTSVDQITAVSGIGDATLAGIRDLVTVGDGKAPAPAATEAAPVAAAPSPAPTGGININTATEAQLQSLTGIGPTKAAAIKADRDTNGPYASCADLQRVNGIGPATVASIGDSCTTTP